MLDTEKSSIIFMWNFIEKDQSNLLKYVILHAIISIYSHSVKVDHKI